MANTSDGPKWTVWSVARGGIGLGELGWGAAMALRTALNGRPGEWRSEGYRGGV